MLVTLKEILNIAEEKQYAIGAFNSPGIANILAVIESAERLHLPVILMHAQVHENLCPLSTIGPAIIAAAKHARVPVCAHLDHGEDADYIKQAISLGFTSVMFDGSTLPYEENVRSTREIVNFAHPYNVSVEAEIGSMGKRESGQDEEEEGNVPPVIYTDPYEAFEFINDTGIDALACSFGTVHGIYLQEPKINFAILDKIREKIKIPLVMHGGSGVSPADYTVAIKKGIRKINYYTYMAKAGGEAVKAEIAQRLGNNDQKPIFYHNIFDIAKQAMADNVSSALKVFSNKI
jgi:fructose-bisphosphate aldolase class II